MNGTGSLVMRRSRSARRHCLSQIVKMVAEAQRSRAPIQKLADAVRLFRPDVIAIALVTFMVWALVGPEPAWRTGSSMRLLCSSSPVRARWAWRRHVDHGGTGKGATVGVLSKRRSDRDAAKVDTLVVDKTGTLTEGKPKLVTIVTGCKGRRTDAVPARGELEGGSEHPLAAAIVGAAKRGMRW